MGVVLRFVDSGDLLAQCNISDLTPLPTGKQVGLEAFQQDVRRAIGERFEQFEHPEGACHAITLICGSSLRVPPN